MRARSSLGMQARAEQPVQIRSTTLLGEFGLIMCMSAIHAKFTIDELLALKGLKS